MWGFGVKFDHDHWRDSLLATVPEANPHEFVRRYLLNRNNKASSPLRRPINGSSSQIVTTSHAQATQK